MAFFIHYSTILSNWFWFYQIYFFLRRFVILALRVVEYLFHGTSVKGLPAEAMTNIGGRYYLSHIMFMNQCTRFNIEIKH